MIIDALSLRPEIVSWELQGFHSGPLILIRLLGSNSFRRCTLSFVRQVAQQMQMAVMSG